MDNSAGQQTPGSVSGAQREKGNSKVDEQATSSPIALGSDLVLLTANQDIRSQIEILQRTVTLVFWYRPNAEPLRLQHTVPTFPLFQLSRFPSLTSDLGLTPTTYLDTFNRDSKQWDQHTISTVRVIDGYPRLLYRIRKSLLEALGDDECVGLKDEIENQLKQRSSSAVVQSPAPTTASPVSPASVISDETAEDKGKSKGPTLKRGAPSSASDTTGPPAKFLVMDGYSRQQQPYPAYLSAPTQNGASTSKPASSTQEPSQQQSPNAESRPSATYPPAGEQSPTSTSPSQYYNNVNRPAGTTQYLYQTPVQYTTPTSPSTIPLPSYLVHPPAAAPLIPYHPHPPLKRWPNDYTVSELSAGFQAMEALVHQTPNGGAAMTQRMAFERVFGSRYVKSTVCRHRGVWRKAPQALREEFEAMGEDERACWGEFVRRVEGRPPGRINGPTLIPVHELPYQLSAQQGSHTQSNGAHAQVLSSSTASVNGNAGSPPVAGNVPNGINNQSEEEEDDDDDEGTNSQDQPIMNSLQFSNGESSNTNNTVHTPPALSTPNGNVPVYDPAIAVAGK